MNQHILLFENQSCNVPDSASRMVGIIDTKCNVCNVIDKAYEEASILCEHTYTVAPDIKVDTHNSVGPPPKKGSRRTPPILMVYPQMPLKFILVELLKNSMRATVERNGTLQLPPIHILVSKGNNDITIKISDQVSTDLVSGSSPQFNISLPYLSFLGRRISVECDQHIIQLPLLYGSATCNETH